MAEVNQCIFCEFGQDPNLPEQGKVFDTPDSFVMLDAYPQIRGHLLVIPRQHFSQLSDLPSNLVTTLFEQAIGLGGLLEQRLGAKAYTLKVNNNLYKLEAAGHVGHVHIHVLPRYSKDDQLVVPGQKSPLTELKDLTAQLSIPPTYLSKMLPST